MSLSQKKAIILKELNSIGLDNGYSIERDSETDFLIFCKESFTNGNCIIYILARDNVYNSIYYYLGDMNDKAKRLEMLELLNRLNTKSSDLKFYLDEMNHIMIKTTYICEDEEFSGDTFRHLLMMSFMSIDKNYYDKIIKLVNEKRVTFTYTPPYGNN